MKRIKLCALALSTCLALGALTGCVSAKETSAEPTTSEVTPATSDDATTASEETDATTEESYEEGAPLPEDFEYVELDAEGQQYANTFISNFAEQSMGDFNREDATIEDLMNFVHIYLKINAYDEISYETIGDVTYETFTWEKAQSIVGKYMGIVLDIAYENLDAPSGAYGDQPAGPYYQDGKIYYEAADGEMHTSFAVVDAVENYYDGTLTLRFTVYSIDYEVYSGLDADGVRAYYKLTPDEAMADDTLTAIASGSAVVDVGQSGDYILISYWAG